CKSPRLRSGGNPLSGNLRLSGGPAPRRLGGGSVGEGLRREDDEGEDSLRRPVHFRYGAGSQVARTFWGNVCGDGRGGGRPRVPPEPGSLRHSPVHLGPGGPFRPRQFHPVYQDGFPPLRRHRSAHAGGTSAKGIVAKKLRKGPGASAECARFFLLSETTCGSPEKDDP